MHSAPVFGKRAAAGAPPARKPASPTASLDHAAFFAAARAEIVEEPRRLVVPRSVRAALIAGLVVGCGLAGLDATRAGETLRALSGGLVSASDAPRLVPVVIALGLYGGAQAAAESLFVAHALLRRLGLTSRLAYASAGGATALGLSMLAAALVDAGLIQSALLPSHGAALDALSGACAGFLYRILAGARIAEG